MKLAPNMTPAELDKMTLAELNAQYSLVVNANVQFGFVIRRKGFGKEERNVVEEIKLRIKKRTFEESENYDGVKGDKSDLLHARANLAESVHNPASLKNFKRESAGAAAKPNSSCSPAPNPAGAPYGGQDSGGGGGGGGAGIYYEGGDATKQMLPAPFNDWEVMKAADGTAYYSNAKLEKTQWVHPAYDGRSIIDLGSMLKCD